jgi:hypothetical protein
VESSVSGSKKFDWQHVIQEALLELDPERLRSKISEAESVIFDRLQRLGDHGERTEERNALKDASNALLTLKKEVLKYPDWRPE